MHPLSFSSLSSGGWRYGLIHRLPGPLRYGVTGEPFLCLDPIFPLRYRIGEGSASDGSATLQRKCSVSENTYTCLTLHLRWTSFEGGIIVPSSKDYGLRFKVYGLMENWFMFEFECLLCLILPAVKRNLCLISMPYDGQCNLNPRTVFCLCVITVGG